MVSYFLCYVFISLYIIGVALRSHPSLPSPVPITDIAARLLVCGVFKLQPPEPNSIQWLGLLLALAFPLSM